MRKVSPLQALFPKTRQALLAALFGQADKWWFLTELAGHLGTTPSSLQRELSALVDSGILEQRREGTRVYFRASHRSPIYEELRGLMEKTAGIVPSVEKVVLRFGSKIKFAMIYGSVARGEENAASDVDLLIIGDIGLADLTPALRSAEKRLGREVNASVYSESEFRKRIGSKDHFLMSVLESPILFVKGNQDELAAIAREQ